MYKYVITLACLAVLVGCLAANNKNMHGSAKNVKLLEGTHYVTIHTTEGPIALELYADKAPKAVTNFVKLAEDGFYENLTFHRVMPDFMIQGGDPRGDGTGGRSIFGSTFEDEDNDLNMERGVIAMANRGPDTNGSQFFIIQREEGTPWLQGKHTAFGIVTDGMDVVDTIANAPTDHASMPLEPITFSAKVE